MEAKGNEKEKGQEIINFLQETTESVVERLKARLGEGLRISLTFLEDNGTPVPNILSFKLIGTLLAKKYGNKEWKEKIETIVMTGASDPAISDVLGMRDANESHVQCLVGRAMFFISPRLRGTMDFFREYNHGLAVNDLVITQYWIKYLEQKNGLVEISMDWGDSFDLLGRTSLDFERNPEVFIKERILKFKDPEISKEAATFAR